MALTYVEAENLHCDPVLIVWFKIKDKLQKQANKKASVQKTKNTYDLILSDCNNWAPVSKS